MIDYYDISNEEFFLDMHDATKRVVCYQDIFNQMNVTRDNDAELKYLTITSMRFGIIMKKRML